MDVALEFEPDFEQAIRQVFSKKLLARDLDTAAHFSKEYELDAITRDGDQVNRRGGFEGGFHDERTSRIDAVTKIRDATYRLSQLQEREKALREESEASSTAVDETLRDLQKLESDRAHHRLTSEQLANELSERSKQLLSDSSVLEKKKTDFYALEGDSALLQQQIAQYEEEKAAPLDQTLTALERNELLELTEKERSLRGAVQEKEQSLVDVAASRDRLRADLKNNLLRRLVSLFVC